jgi:hypothetical protein
MQDSAPKTGRRWARICALVAAVYAVPVVFAVWSNLPSEARIDADIASSAMTALQQSDSKYKSVTPQSLRRRIYRGLSDREVTARVREQAAVEEQRIAAETGKIPLDAQQAAPGSSTEPVLEDKMPSASAEPLRPQLSITMEDLDKARAERIAALNTDQAKAIASGVFAWLVPMIALYLLGPRLWSLRSKRSKRVRRL